MSRLIAGAGTEGIDTGWAGAKPPIGPTAAERLEQLTQQMAQLRYEMSSCETNYLSYNKDRKGDDLEHCLITPTPIATRSRGPPVGHHRDRDQWEAGT